MAKKDIIKHQVKKGQVLNPNGRPKKLVSSILADLKNKGELVTRHMVTETYQVLMSLNEEQLKEIANDKEQPMLNRIVAKEMLSKKGFDIIEKMMDRANGKAMIMQEISQDVTTGGDKLNGISPIQWIDEQSKGDKDK